MAIMCPFHRDLGQTVEAHVIGIYDDEDFNHVGAVEMNQFQCDGDPVHTWEHPSSRYWLYQMSYGAFWRKHRELWDNGEAVDSL